MEMHQHKGPARIFATEEAACDALNADELNAGDVVIVRNVGPKGDPGMLLLQRFLWRLAAKNLQHKIAFMTDGRFSGTNKGCAVAHIAPEAAAGGPLAVVQDGDMIEIDIPKRGISLDLDDRELNRRLAQWKPPEPKHERGILSWYAENVTSSDRGAVLEPRQSADQGGSS